MGTLSARSNPIAVASGPYIPGLPTLAGRGATTIDYTREFTESIWETIGGSGPTLRIGAGPGPLNGSFVTPSIRVGQLYEVAVYKQNESPAFNTGPTAYLRVGVISRNARRPLITSRNFVRGGTWCGDDIRTSALTHVVVISAETTAPMIGPDGVPRFGDITTVPTAPLAPTRRTRHIVDLVGLQPGLTHTYAVVVMNSRGEWDVAIQPFTALRRQMEVRFPQITILNDGDNDTRVFGRTFPDPGEANFWFRSQFGPRVQTFRTHRIDIYDGRAHGFPAGIPYPTTVVQTDGPVAVPRAESPVRVESWAREDDWPAGTDAADSILSTRGFLSLPSGRGENASGSLTLNCLPSSAGSPLHYTADVNWNVAYVP